MKEHHSRHQESNTDSTGAHLVLLLDDMARVTEAQDNLQYIMDADFVVKFKV